jgi:hypothetical protein
VTEEDGSYRLPGVPTRKTRVVAELQNAVESGSTEAELAIHPGENPLDLVLDPHAKVPHEVRGRMVAEDGSPLPGVHLLARDGTAPERTLRSDDDGDVRFTHLRPGHYLLQVEGMNVERELELTTRGGRSRSTWSCHRTLNVLFPQHGFQASHGTAPVQDEDRLAVLDLIYQRAQIVLGLGQSGSLHLARIAIWAPGLKQIRSRLSRPRRASVCSCPRQAGADRALVRPYPEHADPAPVPRLRTAEPRHAVHGPLSPLPCWEHLTAPEYQRRIEEIVDDIESQAALKRRLHDRPAKGPESVLAQEPHGAPETLKKSPAPLFHAASRRVRQEFYEAYKYFVAAFKDAAARLRAGESDVLFPAESFPPASPWVSG